MNLLRVALCFALAVVASHLAVADSCQAQREYDEIVSTVSARFYDKTLRGLDWPARAAHHRAAVICNASDREIAAHANALLAELRASHTAVYTKADIDYWGLNALFSSNPADYQLNFSGIWPEQRAGRWYAKYVLEDSPAARAGITPGDRLLSLNDKPFTPLEWSNAPAAVRISSNGITRRTVQVTPDTTTVMQAFIDATKASRRTLDVGNERVGYFHLWTARDVILHELDAALGAFEAAHVAALVLDLRGGYGGTSLDYLVPLRSRPHLMSIPRYFLIDDGVRSGKEMLAATIRKEKLGVLVGSRTAGAFLGAVPVRLFDNRYLLVVAAFGGTLPDLPPIEGVGVSPDIAVPACRERCGGRDPQLAKALSMLKAELSSD